jgi:hypothetical protein
MAREPLFRNLTLNQRAFEYSAVMLSATRAGCQHINSGRSKAFSAAPSARSRPSGIGQNQFEHRPEQVYISKLFGHDGPRKSLDSHAC